MVTWNKNKRTWIICHILGNILVSGTLIYFTCYDVWDLSRNWVVTINLFFVFSGLIIYAAIAALLLYSFFKATTLCWTDWALYITISIIPFFVSAIIQEKWMLAGIMLVYAKVNEIIVKYILGMDKGPLNSMDEESNNRSASINLFSGNTGETKSLMSGQGRSTNGGSILNA